MKTCWKCKVSQPTENFAINRTKSSGRAAECKACVAVYNKRHVEENREYYQRYRKAKRLHNLAWYLFLECRTRAKSKGLEFDLDPSDLSIPVACPVFGFSIGPGLGRDRSASVDRIDPLKGYIKGNVRIISYLANRMKSNASESQLRQFALWILEDLNGDSQTALAPRQGTRTNTHQSAH